MSTCNVDVRWFPFDIQRCELKFGSWTYDGWLLDLQMNNADISSYMPNGEWDLIGDYGWRFRLSQKPGRAEEPIFFPLCLRPDRGSWHQERGLLRLLQGALPSRDLRGGHTPADALLRPEPSHPLRAAVVNDSAHLCAAG